MTSITQTAAAPFTASFVSTGWTRGFGGLRGRVASLVEAASDYGAIEGATVLTGAAFSLVMLVRALGF